MSQAESSAAGRSAGAGGSRTISALSQAVSQLSRTSRSGQDGAGSSLEIGEDADVDAYIGQMLLEDARARAGGSSFRNRTSSSAPSQARAAPTNKGFLARVINQVDGHNRAVLARQGHSGDWSEAEQKHLRDSTTSTSSVRRPSSRERGGEEPLRWADVQSDGRRRDNPRKAEAGILDAREQELKARLTRPRAGDAGSPKSERGSETPYDAVPEESQASSRRQRFVQQDDIHHLPDLSREDAKSTRSRRGSHHRSSDAPRHDEGDRAARLPDAERELYSSKMDRYFEPDYDAALDAAHVGDAGIEDGQEGEMLRETGWEKMWEVVKERRERKEKEDRERKERKVMREQKRRRRSERKQDTESPVEKDKTTRYGRSRHGSHRGHHKEGSEKSDRHLRDNEHSSRHEAGEKSKSRRHRGASPASESSSDSRRAKRSKVRGARPASPKIREWDTGKPSGVSPPPAKVREWDMGKRSPF
ncbi:hypothetical protein IE81DRAFT_365146 [Ceraceosorus guamensis]|uniref:Uncharacterized protein n=1 Tax=Ceraceosorus guamensis TaxID=1522189 RepID=A0A316W386_9BASI|nr:hypothetical protein IE81DRAFT_365146 [Ceraceosorus guamensis]PWN44182.1 hypothetical protein IE81DRAFT_365146 [Ceraceosorus guamensis]